MNATEARERRNAVGAAVVMHLALLAALFVSLNWTREARQPVQAELWAAPPGDLPRVMSPQPETRAPAAPQPALPPLPLPTPAAKADISLEKPPPPKKEPPKKADPPKKAEPPKKTEPPRKTEPPKAEPKRAEPPKKVSDNERKRQEAERRQAEERTARQLQEQRQSELSRLGLDPAAKQDAQGKDAVSRTGVATGAEIGARTGVDADYEALIQARIKARINYPDRSPGNPEAVILVEQLPSGEVSAVKLLRSSGIPAWDAAVQRAIWAASPLPKRKDGSVARVLELGFRPRETR